MNINEIKNKENSINIWEQFIQIAPQSVKNTVNFDDNLSKQLIDMRNQQPEPEAVDELTRQPWMHAAEMAESRKIYYK